MRLYLLLSFLSLSQFLLSQKNLILKGQVFDTNKQTIIGATILCAPEYTTGTATDMNGCFELKLKNSTDSIKISYIGYETHIFVPNMNSEERQIFVLQEVNTRLDEVVVSANRFNQKITNTQIGAESVTIEQIKKMPTLFGEADIIKSITLLPGVKSAGDGTNGFQVRGGTAAQNLILLDNAPIYNAGHIMGVFSSFNDDVLANATLYKGLVPAQYGGATASVLNVKTLSGETRGFKAGIDIGILSSNAYIQGDLIEEKLSYQVAARRSYFDLFLKLTDDYDKNTIYFYDVNAKINYNPTQNDRLSLAIYSSKDRMGMDDMMDMDWTNRSLSLQWFHRYDESLTSNTFATASAFRSDNAMDVAGMNGAIGGGVDTYGIKHVMQISKDKSNWNMGLQSSLIDVATGDFRLQKDIKTERRKGVESALWTNLDYKLSPMLSISGGLRFTSFAALGGADFYEFDQQGNILKTLSDYDQTDIVKHYFHIEPRLSANWRIKEDRSLKAGYARTTQNIYNILNASMGIPYTRYTMASNYLKPAISDQISLAYTRMLNDEQYELSVEAYYKEVQNIYDYKDGKTFSTEIELESLLFGGRSRSYGVEVLAKRNTGKLTGWIGYTLSWTKNKIDGINNNQWYTATNDIRHDLSIVSLYQINDQWSASASWVYQTGQALNAPSAKYELDGKPMYYYAERNGYRAPAYHRLDFSFIYEKKLSFGKSKLSFGVYNAYMQYNPYVIKFEDDPDNPTGTKTTLNALFGLLPSITYGLHF